MKKLVTSGFKGRVCTGLVALALLVIYPLSDVKSQLDCIMTCPPMAPPVPIFLPADCADELTYDEIGVTLTDCQGPIIIDILENGVSIGDSVTADMIGNTYMVIITDDESDQSCMTMILVLDGQPPTVNCPPDITLECNADLSEYNGLSPQDIFDCSSYTVFIDDVLLTPLDCEGDTVSQYLRTYYIVDEYNNADTCTQLISLIKADLADVVFPPDLSGPTALNCFPPPDTSPDATGYPTINGNDILNGTYCNLTAVFIDLEVPVCSGTYKIIRTWTVTDWCANNQSITDVQVIEIADLTAPIVIAPDDITVSTDATSCSADVILPPATVLEDCSTSWTVRMSGPFGTIQSNGGPVQDLPIGVHAIIYTALNDCGLEGSDTMYLTVEDLQPPIPVCNQGLAIPVGSDGTALVPAFIFNSASYDNCSNVFFKVKRMSLPLGSSCFNPGNPTNAFDDFIQLCCEDIENNNIMIILRVYDVPPVAGPVPDNYLQGHFNDCMVQVQVQDKLPPQIICPSDITISCEFPYVPENLEVFGKVALSEAERDSICIDDPGFPGNPGLQCIGFDGLATDNCSVDLEELDPVIVVNNCGTGTITRTFVATDDGGFQSSCQQVISIINYDPFTENDIIWPLDLMTFDICEIDLLDPEDLPPPFNQPIVNEGPCDLVGMNYEDDVFDFSNDDEACFKILRTWTVIDWCQLNTPSGGTWSHIQVLKVMNNTPPDIEPIEDVTECSFDPECGGLTIDFEANATDDCSGPASLTWRYFIDLDNDHSFDFSSGNIIGETLQFTREMPIGTHRILYTVSDLCGNTSTAEQLVTIESCKLPSPVCIEGLSTNLMAMDTDGDGTADWGMVVLQAEMFDAGSYHACGNTVTLAFSPDPLDVSRVFDCEDLGLHDIDIWVIDQNGSADFCTTTIEIQDNNNVCPPGQTNTGVIAGHISVPGSGNLSGAMVYLDGSNQSGIPTGMDGYFVFPSMPFGGQYSVRPVREGDARNGVTTLDLVKLQKHLLGIQNFSTPFQYIAADANNSTTITAVDIIQLRKLILGYYNELPSNKSWRFIDKAHVFPDPHNPWGSAIPETYSIIPFAGTMSDVDFHAIKIGDLNLSASLQAHSGMLMPRGSERCELEYTITPMTEHEFYRIDLYLTQARNYNALQFSFNWDQVGYELMDWSAGDLFSKDDFRMPEKVGDNASMSIFSTDGWNEEKIAVLTLWVKQLTPGGIPFQIFLNPSPTEPIAYTTDAEEPRGIRIIQANSPEPLAYNRPNPFRDMTTIYMSSSREEPAVMRIYNLNGKLMTTRKLDLLKGTNEFVVHKSELGGAGIYMYEIESNFQYSTNRMIIVD